MECQVLSEISWPLVLSTNYDTMFTDTYAENEKLHGNSIKVFGREPKDSHSLLASLNASTQTAYWALQGYFGNNYRNEELGGEIVVGYRQYRNATFNNMTFRSVFGEVFRNNSFLFLGTGFSEDYFRGLFGEVLEKFGSNPHSHCALFREQDFDSGLVDHHFLNTKLNIIAISYKDPNDDYSGLHTAIQQLRDAFRKERNNLWKLSFGSKNISQISDLKDKPSLEIIAGTLPHPKKSECVIISAGYDSEGVRLSHYGKRLILACLKEKYDSKKFISKKGLVSQYGDTVFYAAIARNIAPGKSSKVSRDLRKIAEAVEDVLRETNGKFEVISMMLLVVGSGCNFPPVFSLIQMIRGYKTFKKKTSMKSVLRIYAVPPSVINYIRTRPLEIEELLNCNDTRITIEIQDKDEIERYQLFIDSKKSLEEVSNFYSINSRFWNASIFPAPSMDFEQIQPNDKESLEALGVIPGSTIIYSRKRNRPSAKR